MARHTLSVREVAEALGISVPHAYKAIRNGTVPALRIGRRLVVPKIALDQLLASATPVNHATTEE